MIKVSIFTRTTSVGYPKGGSSRGNTGLSASVRRFNKELVEAGIKAQVNKTKAGINPDQKIRNAVAFVREYSNEEFEQVQSALTAFEQRGLRLNEDFRLKVADYNQLKKDTLESKGYPSDQEINKLKPDEAAEICNILKAKSFRYTDVQMVITSSDIEGFSTVRSKKVRCVGVYFPPTGFVDSKKLESACDSTSNSVEELSFDPSV